MIEPRPAIVDDAPACAIIVRDWLDGTSWMTGGPPRSELEEIFAEGIPLREFWVIGDPVAGYLSLIRETAQIKGLYVATPGQGLGKALMDQVKQGRDYLQLQTHEPNKAAHRFYTREGFVTVARDLDGDDGVPERRMEWRR